MAETAERLVTATARSGKSYRFDVLHDRRRPVQHWFQQEPGGVVLFVVFYTQACRWSLCTGCNLPSKASLDHVDFAAIMAQIDDVFGRPDVVAAAPTLHKLIVSNQGSVLDEATFSSTALLYLVAKANLHLPKLDVLCLETRAEYVDEAELDFLARALAEGPTETTLELGVGFEAFDYDVRNHEFGKGLTLETFEQLANLVSDHGFGLKTYFMQKPVVEMTDAEAVDDVREAIDYLARVATETGARISMHLNPTYAATGTPLATAFLAGEWHPPRLRDVVRAALHARGRGLPLYVGLNDEGMAVPGGSFARPEDGPLLEALERFNRTQDFSVLDAALQPDPSRT